VIADGPSAVIGVSKSDGGTWTLSGTNTYSGATTVSGGTLEIGGSGVLGSGAYAANITNNATFSYNSTASQTLSGVISGTGALVKNNTGTLSLTGPNTYSGATTVSGGKLAVNGSLASASSVTVQNGGTLQGSGSIGGSVTIQNGGTLATGNSIESLATGALSLQALATFAQEINKDAAATVAGDLTAVTGNLTLDLGNTAILTLTELGSGSWSANEKLTLISYSGTWNGGLFNYGGTLADDSTINFSGATWQFNYNDTVAGSNYTSDLTGTSFVTMTVIPEPNVAALLGGLGTLLLRRRRS
jgi:autotransporter-associated beta strand protein